MKSVNLLPEWYLQKARDRRKLQVRIALMSLLACAMLGWVLFGQTQVARLRLERDALQKQASVVGRLDQRVDEARAEVERLKRLETAYKELGATIPMSAVMRQIQNDLTPGMALSRTAIEVRCEAVKGSGFVGDPANPPKFQNVARITVVGIGPNDILISQLIDKLSRNPLFSEVTLNYARTELLRDYDVRRFEIQVQINLDRLEAEEPANSREVGKSEDNHGF